MQAFLHFRTSDIVRNVGYLVPEKIIEAFGILNLDGSAGVSQLNTAMQLFTLAPDMVSCE